MIKIDISKNIDKIEEVFYFFNKPISLCGSVADYFLLKQKDFKVKDLDFVTQDYSIIEEYKKKFIYCKTKAYGESLYTKDINNLNIDIFYSRDFIYEKESLSLKDYKIRCVTPEHRVNFLKTMINNFEKYQKPVDKLQEIVDRYLELYSCLIK